MRDENGNNVSWKELERLFKEHEQALDLARERFNETVTRLDSRIGEVERRLLWMISVGLLLVALAGFVGGIVGYLLKP